MANLMSSLRNSRSARFDPGPAEFRKLGHDLVERLAGFYESLPARKVTTSKSRAEILDTLPPGGLPAEGTEACELLAEVAPLLLDNALHNGHPRFLGYITSSGAPLGALADMLAAAVNSNLAKWELSPIASEIEAQTIRWIAEFVRYPVDCGGLMVSGGNMANLHAFLAARQAAAVGGFRESGVRGEARRLTVYASRETHTWIEKAVEFTGLGASSIRWIDTDARQRMDVARLCAQIESDKLAGCKPFLVVATAGTISTGVIDPIREMADVCDANGLWLHVDGAYGAPAASLPESPDDLRALALADSVAVDPHKWLYSPIEAACVLTKDPDALRSTFDFQPAYYHLQAEEGAPVDYYRQGLQNTRGFRALKVWLSMRNVGANGYRESIREDIALARHLFESAGAHPDLDAVTCSLSIATFRYCPADLVGDSDAVSSYVDALNKALLVDIQQSGQMFISNAVVNGNYVLRACIVNFRTTVSDIDAVVETVGRIGKSLDARMRPENLAA